MQSSEESAAGVAIIISYLGSWRKRVENVRQPTALHRSFYVSVAGRSSCCGSATTSGLLGRGIGDVDDEKAPGEGAPAVVRRRDFHHTDFHRSLPHASAFARLTANTAPVAFRMRDVSGQRAHVSSLDSIRNRRAGRDGHGISSSLWRRLRSHLPPHPGRAASHCSAPTVLRSCRRISI